MEVIELIKNIISVVILVKVVIYLAKEAYKMAEKAYKTIYAWQRSKVDNLMAEFYAREKDPDKQAIIFREILNFGQLSPFNIKYFLVRLKLFYRVFKQLS